MSRTFLALGLVALLCGRVVSDETEGVAPPIRRVIETAELVLENHIDPPTRQEMVLAATRALYAGAGRPVPPELGSRVSALSDPGSLGGFLEGVWKETASSWQSHSEPGRVMLEAVAATMPGNASLLRARDYEVNGQVASNLYVGIGIALRKNPDDEMPVMTKVFKGGPADLAGAMENDFIVKIDGTDTIGLSLRKVVDLLRGPKGSRVTLVLRQPGDGARPRTYTITRDVVPFETVTGYRKFSKSARDAICYLNLESISGSAVHELRQLARKMRGDGIRGVVLDVRGNTGGAIHHAVLLADALLAGGSIGGVRLRESTRAYSAGRDCLFKDMPLAILVDRRTRGTSEWLATALQDNGRAIVVGEHSAGDAFVRRGVALPGGELVMLMATGVLERPDGSRLGRVEPDYPADNARAGVARAVELLRSRLQG